jgi:serpin B
MALASNTFGLDIYQRLRAEGNVAVSPASLSLALSLAAAGARGGTAAEMTKVLHLDRLPAADIEASTRLLASLERRDESFTLSVANRMFGQDGMTFDAAYLDAARSAHGAPLERLDFRGAPEPSRLHINDWVGRQTEQRIRDLVPPGGIQPLTSLVLVNALYFLAKWEVPFKHHATWPLPFHVSPMVTRQVPTMQTKATFPFFEDRDLKALALPYRGGRASMVFVLPQAAHGLGALEASLTHDRLESLVVSLRPETVLVALPRFEVDPAGSLSVGPLLQGLGMREAFDPERADFTGIAAHARPEDRLALGAVFHKAFVKVDEEGTEAAAATAVSVPVGSARPKPTPVFRADHPFLFLIRDSESGLILFLGRVVDPTVR